MYFNKYELLSLSIAIPVIVGWVRFNKINNNYYPFILLLTIGFINEILSIILINNGVNNSINTNIYFIVETALILWQFAQWNLFKNKVYWLFILSVILVILWLVDWIILSDANNFLSYYIIVSSFIIVVMSIQMMNQLLITVRSNPFVNAVFLISSGFIIFYTYGIMVEIFWIYGFATSNEFKERIYEILAYINLFVNIVFAFAILWIPTKPKFILQS